MFCSSYNVILIFNIQFIEITAPAPNPNNKIRIMLRVLLRIKQPIPID